MFGIIALRKSSSLSAMLGLGFWLVFAIVTPALINLFVSASAPLPNRVETIHVLRTLNNKTWDSPKSYVFNQFYPKHPQYNEGDTINFNKWYYAGFTLLDDKAKSLNHEFETQAANRNQLLEKWQWIAPAAMAHEKFSSIAETDRESHLRFVNKIHRFHDDLKAIYYPKIFTEETFNQSDLIQLKGKLEE